MSNSAVGLIIIGGFFALFFIGRIINLFGAVWFGWRMRRFRSSTREITDQAVAVADELEATIAGFRSAFPPADASRLPLPAGDEERTGQRLSPRAATVSRSVP